MRTRCLAATMLASATLTGCASAATAPTRAPGGLVGGTAQLAVDGGDTTTRNDVACRTSESLTEITIGSSNGGATVYIDNSKSFTARGIQFRDVDHFTGSYWQGIQGSATAGVVDQTYVFTGTAAGFVSDRPEQPVTKGYTVRVAC
jgi:ipoprotein LpqH